MTDAKGLMVELETSHPQAVDQVTAALKQEGFGVLTRIDIHRALKEKLDVEFRPYTILGACNPPLAHRALSASPEVGLLLPCNVTIEEAQPGLAIVRLVNPLAMMKTGAIDDNPEVEAVANEAAERLARVADALGKD